MTSLEQAKTIVKVLDKKKGKDIKLVEIKNLSSLGDYFVIASATSTTQVKSLADEVEEEMTKLGFGTEPCGRPPERTMDSDGLL